MGTTTTTALAELIPDVVAEATMWLDAMSLFYPVDGSARDFITYRDLRNRPGVTGEFNTWVEITAGDATEGIAYPTTSALDVTNVQVSATEKVVVVPITDMMKRNYAFGAAQLVAEAGKQMGKAMANKVDGDVFALFDNLGTSKITSNNPVTMSGFSSTIAGLLGNGAQSPFAAFVHPWGWHEWAMESGSALQNVAASGSTDKAIWERYEVANVAGVRIFQSSNITSDGTDYSGAVMSAEAIGMTLENDFVIEVERSAIGRQDYLVGVMSYGVGVINSSCGYELHQDAD